ncbi:MAG: TspO/MBR family protein [bacterium]|nr:TspO/MBR family protein [bacterium]
MLVLFLALSLSAGLFGSQFEPGEWYEQLAKPSWTPPNWLFAPVWTFLYLAMGVAAWLVWQRVGWRKSRLALLFFIVQLILNAVWSWVFFGLHRPGLAFGEIILLWAAILITLVLFWRHRSLSGRRITSFFSGQYIGNGVGCFVSNSTRRITFIGTFTIFVFGRIRICL